MSVSGAAAAHGVDVERVFALADARLPLLLNLLVEHALVHLVVARTHEQSIQELQLWFIAKERVPMEASLAATAILNQP